MRSEEKEVKVSNMSALDKLGVSKEEAKEALDNVEMISGRKDGRVCICGHSNGRHLVSSYGNMTCQAAKQPCECKQIRLVVKASDTRPFLRKTSGSGPFHALIQGIASAEEKGIEVEWLIDPTCDRCGSESEVTVVTVDRETGQELTESKGYDKFLCSECRSV